MPYQVRWISDPSPLKIIEKGRQEGFTWIEALWTVLRRLDTKIDHYFVSADEETAKNFINDCKFWCEKINALARMTGHKTDPIDLSQAIAGMIPFPNGARIIALSSNPKSIRGKRGDVTLDEFAFHEFAEKMMAAAIACKRWGDGKNPGHLHLVSTHNGPGTLFYRLCRNSKEHGYSHHLVTLVDAVNDGLADKVPGDHHLHPAGPERNKAFIDRCRQECTSREMFEQEYMCQPLSASALILPHEYDAMVELAGELANVPDAFDFGGDYGGDCLYVGVDVGRSNDLTCIWVLRQRPDPSPDLPDSLRNVYASPAVILLKNMEIVAQYQVLRPILSHRNTQLCCIDQGTIGRALSDMAVAEFGEGIVQPLAMTKNIKAELAERVKFFIQSQRVAVPRDEAIREDILSLRREVTDRGVITYDGRSKIGHSDCFWGLALALHAAEQSTPLSVATIEYQERQQREQPRLEQPQAA